MANNWKILITDYAWASIEPERQVLAEVGAELIAAETGDAAELQTFAPTMDGILTCWNPVREPSHRRREEVSDYRTLRHRTWTILMSKPLPSEASLSPTFLPTVWDEVSDHAMGLLLACARKIPRFDRAIRNGTWDQNIGPEMHRIRGKTLGIVGFGRIGQALIPKAKAFGLSINVCSPRTRSQTNSATRGAQKVTFQELLATSDFITIHAPLTQETQCMFSDAEFRAMKSTAFLINTARGGIVDTAALTTALRNGDIAGAKA